MDPVAKPTTEATLEPRTFWRIVCVVTLMVFSLFPIVWPTWGAMWAGLLMGAFVLLAGAAEVWRRKLQPAWLESERARAEALIEDARSMVEYAWAQAADDIHKKPTMAELKAELLLQLVALETALPLASREKLRHIERSARLAARKRAHFLSDTCVACEATSAVRQMELWGVPRSYVEGELFPLLALAQGAPPAATALEQLLDEYDYWDHYTTQYVGQILPALCLILVLTILEALGWSLYWAFERADLLIAFALAAAAGSALSVLLRLPPIGVYGQQVSAGVQLLGRFTTGLVMGGVGLGVVTLGLINIPVTTSGAPGSRVPITLSVMVERCITCRCNRENCKGWGRDCAAGQCGAPSDQKCDAGECVSEAGAAGDASTRLPGGPDLDAGTDAQALHDADVDASDGRDGATAVIAAVHDAGTAAHDAGGADKRRDEITDTTPIQCEPGWMLGLLGIAVLLGFSERVFSGLSENLSRQFGDQTQTRAAPPPPRTPPAPPKDEPSTTRTNATPSADQKTTPQA